MKYYFGVFLFQETANRVKMATFYLRGIAKMGFPGKAEFAAMVNEELIKKKVKSEMDATPATATTRRSMWFI